jgi:hypothetical protein
LPNVTPTTNIRVAPFATDSWAPSNLATVSQPRKNFAIASFPFRTAGIAKLGFAAASSIPFNNVPLRNRNDLRNENSRHMVTPGSTLNDPVAFKASLPSFLRCCLNKALQCLIFRAIALMAFAFAGRACFLVALLTGRNIFFHKGGLDESIASFFAAISAIWCCQFDCPLLE